MAHYPIPVGEPLPPSSQMEPDLLLYGPDVDRPEMRNSTINQSPNDEEVPLSERFRSLVLVGNPNVGKSVVFHQLTGQYTQVSNFPGTTLDVPWGTMEDSALTTPWRVEDTPGVYGLAGDTDEERVAEAALWKAIQVINVVSAVTLARDLFLTQQLIDWGKPLIVLLNQMDELENSGQKIDVETLSERLGVPVIPVVATQGGVKERVIHSLEKASAGNTTPGSPTGEGLRAVEKSNPAQRLHLYGLRRHYVNVVLSQVLSTHSLTSSRSLSAWLGAQLLSPVGGFLALILILLTLYQVVGVWVAGDLVDFLENKILLATVIPAIQAYAEIFFPKDSFVYTLLVGEFGLLTMTPQYVLGVMLPLVVGFYLYLSLLEDSGVLPRVAVLMDGFLRRVGLNGRAIIPMILGLGCVTMASIATRLLTTQRERTIASVLLAITIPCSAQLAVIVGLMAKVGGFGIWLLFLLVLFLVFTVIGSVLQYVLPGQSAPLVLDLPPLRLPNLSNIFKKTWLRSKAFLLDTLPVFIVGSFLVSMLQLTGLFQLLQTMLSPLVASGLRLPSELGQVFIMGMVRRDFGVAGLYSLSDGMSPLQILVSLVVITLFVPCIASASVIWKERGPLESSFTLLASWMLAFLVGAGLSWMLALWPVL
ncbi:MAG: ferrous iron transporter B [Candidatus Melainabacteria bacterium]|nr:ferrous iron transporter B [Candidatus Melainabacteria bacterium]